MKILAILLIIIGLSKIILCMSINPSDPVFKDAEISKIFSPEWVYAITGIIISGDGIIGLSCGLFILSVI